tara:strand:- start:368 stop:727 length:360 start_codon:yes stop_codon:yes gene_type:complete
MENSIFKILTVNEWKKAKKNKTILTKRDLNDGYIHLSTSKQLPLTLSLYFKKYNEVFILQIDKKEISENLKYENNVSSKRKSKFPHYFGTLSTKNIIKSWCIKRNGFKIPDKILLFNES